MTREREQDRTSERARAVVVRDPVWDTIRLDPTAVRVVDSAPFQRLRYIRQLGLAHLVYPGATHTRFDHALGVYHLARRALAVLDDEGHLAGIPPVDCRLIPLAALLHDVGHYPFSHALEELEERRIPGHHETLAERFLEEPVVRGALGDVAPDAALRVGDLIRGRSDHPLQGLVSGSLDLDKIEYLMRDARFCGVPYGEVDVDRLLHALMVLEDPASGRREIGVHEKGVAALESLLFSKYQMFRNVYWHHAVRAATVLYKRIVADALDLRLIEQDELPGQTDEGLLGLLASRSESAAGVEVARVASWIAGLRTRQLPKRAGEVVAAELGERSGAAWLTTDTTLKRAFEDCLAGELGLTPGAVFLDYPAKPAMFALDLLVHRRGGEVIRLGPAGQAGLIDLPRMAEELYRTARVLRLFTLGARREVAGDVLAGFASLSEADARSLLSAGAVLLAGRSR